MRHKTFQKYSSILLVIIGFILISGPRHWFPDFYSPIFLGIIAVISPFLIYLPEFILNKDTPQKKELILTIRSVIAFSLAINIAGELGLYQLYRYGFQYDKFAHFTVSMLFAFILSESLKEWGNFTPNKIVWLVLLIVFSSGLLWELFEAFSDFLFKTQEWGNYGKDITWDTLWDITFNTLGALAGIIVSKIPKGQNKKSPKVK